MNRSTSSAPTRSLKDLEEIIVNLNITERYSDLSDDALWMAEDEWYEHEEHTKELDWLNMGIALYSELFRRNPNDGRYSVQLSDLLLKTATDAKLHHLRYDLAKRLLSTVLQLDRKNALAHYRLGFVCYELKDYHRAVKHLECACKIRSQSSRYNISELQHAKALEYTWRAYQNLQSALLNLIDRFKDQQEDVKIVQRLENIFDNMTGWQEDGPKQFVVLTPEDERDADESEVAGLERKTLSTRGALYFVNRGGQYSKFQGYGQEVELTGREAELLTYLIRKREATDEEIKHDIFPETKPGSPVVRRTVGRVREALSKLPIEPNQIIERRDSKYHWTHKNYLVACSEKCRIQYDWW